MISLQMVNNMYIFKENDESAVREVCAMLRNGGVAAVPTETVYGLICAWNNADAREAIYLLKKRPHDKRLQMLAPDIATAVRAGLIPDARLARIAEKFWPGPLTVVAKADGNGVNGDSIGLRIPAHPFIMKVLKELGSPVAATSANLAGTPPGLNAHEAVANLDGSPGVLIDGGSVKETGGRASTVISLLGDAPSVLREGPVSLQEILEAIK